MQVKMKLQFLLDLHTMEEIVRQVGYLPELYEDARSEKYKILILAVIHNK